MRKREMVASVAALSENCIFFKGIERMMVLIERLNKDAGGL